MDKRYICLFSVVFSCDDDSEPKLQTEHGMIFANTFTDAVSQIEHQMMYGGDLVQITNLELFDAIPTFSAETMKKMKEELESR